MQSWAQNPEYIQYTIKDGLPSMECYDVIQDKQGYIWIGTDRGLVKYNGTKFEVLTTEEGLPSNVIYKFYQDDEGMIWCSAKNSQIFYIDQGEINLYKYNQVIADSIGKLREDIQVWYNSDRKELMGTVRNQTFLIDSNGVYHSYLPKGISRHVKSYESNSSFLRTESVLVVYRREGRVMTEIMGVHQPTKASGVKEHLVDDGTDWVIPSPMITAALYGIPYGEKGAYVCANHQLLQLDGTNTKAWDFEEQPIYVASDPDVQSIWVGVVNQGAYRIARDGEIKEHVLDGYSISSLFFDDKGNCWATSLEGGLFLIPSNTFFKTPLDIQGKIVGIDTYENSLYMLSFNGVLAKLTNGKFLEKERLKSASRREYVSFKVSKEGQYETTYWEEVGSWEQDPLSLLRDRHQFGNSVIGILRGYVGVIDSLGNRRQMISTQGYIENLLHVGGEFYVATNDGINRVDLENSSIEELNISGVQGMPILKAQEYKKGLIFIIQGKGVFRIDDMRNPEAKCLLSNSELVDMCLDRGKIWTTDGSNIYRINLKGDRADAEFFSTPIDGIRYIQLTRNDLYLITTESVFSTRRKGLSFNRKNIYLEIKSLRSNKKELEWKNELYLEVDENQLEIGFDMFCFMSSQKTGLRYKLEENDNWLYAYDNRMQLSSLRHGEHHLIVQFLEVDGNWTSLDTVRIIVATPFWKTIWFYVVISTIFVLTVSLIARSIVRRKALKAKAAELELSVITQQINPHFIFNSLNSIRSYIFSNKLDEADDYLVSFSKLTRKILSISRESFATLEDEIDVLKDYLDLEKMRSGDQFDYSIELEGTRDELATIPSLLTQPFVENSVIHGVLKLKEKRGRIDVRFFTADDGLKIEIDDNGVGRNLIKPSKKHKSFGIELVRDRLKIYDKNSFVNIKDKKDPEGNAAGTLITIILTK